MAVAVASALAEIRAKIDALKRERQALQSRKRRFEECSSALVDLAVTHSTSSGAARG